MEDKRREGQERRQVVSNIPEERRESERRALLGAPEKTVDRLKNLSIFKGLTEEQLNKMVRICSKKKYAYQDEIYRINDKSDDMFILLKGKISISFNTGVVLQDIVPAGVVGEMGVFTGETRSATVIAGTDCLVLNINKYELIKLCRNDMDLWVKIQSNVIRDLSHKVRKDNEIIEELMYRVRSLEIL